LGLHKLSCVLSCAHDCTQEEITRIWILPTCHMCPNSRCFRPFHAAPGNQRIQSGDMVAHSNCKMAKTVRELDTVMQLWNHDTNQVMEAIARNGGDAVVAAEIWKQREYKQSVYPINEWELTMFSQAELSKMDDLVRLIFVNRQYRQIDKGEWNVGGDQSP